MVMCHFNCDTGSCELSPTYRISNKQYQKRVLSFFLQTHTVMDFTYEQGTYKHAHSF